MPNIIIADKSYKLSELAAATVNAATDIFYVVKLVEGEEVAYKITRQQLLSGVGGTLAVEDNGSPVGSASILNFIAGANITFNISDAGGGQIDVEVAASGSVSVSWGSITGTLANQVDLQNTLNFKLESGDNVSELVNDAGYLTLSDLAGYLQAANNLSDLTNAGAARTNLELGAAAIKGVTGNDANAVTGTAGASGNLSQWNADGDLVDSSIAASSVLTAIPDEEEIVGTAIYNASVTGAFNLDLSSFAAARLILTGNTTLTVTNTPASGKSFVRSLKVSSTATETLTFPGTWEIVSGTYSADTTINDIQIEFSNFPTAGLIVSVYINQFP